MRYAFIALRAGLESMLSVAEDLEDAALVALNKNYTDYASQNHVDPPTQQVLLDRVVATAAERLLATGVVFFFQMRSMGGAVADVPVDATAFAHRSARFQLNAFGTGRVRLNAV